MEETSLNFESARNKAILKVMKGDRERYASLEKRHKILASEHNMLKKTYLELLDGHLDIVDGKNKTIKKLRWNIKGYKEEIECLKK